MEHALLETARVARSRLVALVGEEDAAGLDAQLAALLARSVTGEEVAGEVAELLMSRSELHSWAAQVLEDPQHRPPEVQRAGERTGGRPAGDGEVVDAEPYHCREGDFVWWRLEVGEPVPRCPTPGHSLPLLRG
ncbi:hypothetical protein [Streptomyces sp. NPDC058964]|uniref:hypothetical protein n=1 Tax=Streptomyces sp. NPDC058964 TaxID=3346681 RepID=UPI00368D28C6